MRILYVFMGRSTSKLWYVLHTLKKIAVVYEVIKEIKSLFCVMHYIVGLENHLKENFETNQTQTCN